MKLPSAKTCAILVGVGGLVGWLFTGGVALQRCQRYDGGSTRISENEWLSVTVQGTPCKLDVPFLVQYYSEGQPFKVCVTYRARGEYPGRVIRVVAVTVETQTNNRRQLFTNEEPSDAVVSTQLFAEPVVNDRPTVCKWSVAIIEKHLKERWGDNWPEVVNCRVILETSDLKTTRRDVVLPLRLLRLDFTKSFWRHLADV